MKKVKNKVLKWAAIANIVLLILSGMALDSNSVIPIVVCGVALTYLTLFIMANTRG